MTADLLAKLFADVFACRECGKEHALRDISHKFDLNGGPIKQFTWADPDDGHAYSHALINTEWLRAWRAEHVPAVAS